MAQISMKKCARITSDSALESSSAGKLVSMKLCVSSIVIEAFSEEEGNVITEKYNGGQFQKFIQANPFFRSKTSKHVILNGLDIYFRPGNEAWACDT